MRLASHLASASIVSLAAAVGQLPPYCQSSSLTVNSANAVTLAGCTELGYRCNDKVVQINSTNEAIPANCTHYLYNVTVDRDIKGPLGIPGMTEVSDFNINGTLATGSAKEFNAVFYSSNITSLDLPDLENVTSSFRIDHASLLTSLNVPKLKDVGETLHIDLSSGRPGESAINLSFPSLSHAHDIWLGGNIDAIEFPALHHTFGLEVHSSGKLDCLAFLAKVSKAAFVSSEGNIWVCTSAANDVTSSSAAPTPTTTPTPTPTGNSARFEVREGLLVLTALIACILTLLL